MRATWRSPLVLGSDAFVFQAIGMLAIERNRLGPATNAEQMVDRIHVVHVVAITNHLPQIGGADTDQTVVLLATECQPGDCQEWIDRVEDVGVGRVAGPGEVTDGVPAHVVHFAGLGAVAAAVYAPRMATVQCRGARSSQGFQCGQAVLRVAAAGQQVDHRPYGVGQTVGPTFNGAVRWDHTTQDVGNFRAFVHPVDRRYRGHQIRTQRGRDARSGRTLAVADQVDLAAIGSGPRHNLLSQCGAALLAVIQRRNTGDIDLGAIAFEVPGDSVEVVDQTADGVKAGPPVYQYDRVFGLGVVGLGLNRAKTKYPIV